MFVVVLNLPTDIILVFIHLATKGSYCISFCLLNLFTWLYVNLSFPLLSEASYSI